MRFLPFVIISLITALILFLPARRPFEISSDMAVRDFTKRFDLANKDISYGFIKYQDKTQKLLSNIGDEDLTEISCSDSFHKNVQGVYIFDNLRVGQVHFVRIKSEDFLKFMREKEGTFSNGKKILTGKICELKDKTILLFYSSGIYDLEFADTTNVRKAIANSWDNTSYVDVIPKNPIFGRRALKIAESENNIFCHSIFQLTDSHELFLLCEEKRDWQSNFYVKKVNIASGKVELLGACLNEHRDKLKTVCN